VKPKESAASFPKPADTPPSSPTLNKDPIAASRAAWGEKTGAIPKTSSSSAAASAATHGGQINQGFVGDTVAAASLSSSSSISPKSAKLSAQIKRSASAPELRQMGSSKSLGGTKLNSAAGTPPVDFSGLAHSKPSPIKHFFKVFGGLVASGAVFSLGAFSFDVIIDAIVGEKAAMITPQELDDIIRLNSDEILNVTMNGTEDLKDEHHSMKARLTELKTIVEEFRKEMMQLKFEQKQSVIETKIQLAVNDLDNHRKGLEVVNVEVSEEERPISLTTPKMAISMITTAATTTTTTTTTTAIPRWKTQNARLVLRHPDLEFDEDAEMIEPRHTLYPDNRALLIAAAVVIVLMLISSWCCVIFIVLRCVINPQQQQQHHRSSVCCCHQ
jgi:hypothetical protein